MSLIDSNIRSLYASGLSKREIVGQGFRYTDVKNALVGLVRTKEEQGQLYIERFTNKNKHILNQSQLDLIYGSLLGDSSLSSYGPTIDGIRRKYTIMFSNSHCDAQYGYVEHMKHVIPMGNIYSRIQKSGYKIGVPVHVFSYKNKGALSEIWDVVMVNNKKTVNSRWVEKLTPRAISYWFMDDGTSCFLRANKGVTINFSTYSFSYPEVELLRDLMGKFGFKFTIRNSKKGPVLGLSQTHSYDFMNFVQPVINLIPCMKYKIKYPR